MSPIKLALVQWIGLAPKDTSWEHWDNVRVSYNLKDKVLLLDGVMIALVSWPLTDQGGPPPSIPQYLQGSSHVEAVDILLSARAAIHSAL